MQEDQSGSLIAYESVDMDNRHNCALWLCYQGVPQKKDYYTMKNRYITFSRKGRRHENQDFVRVVHETGNGAEAFILCDGMGGHAMGRMAASIVGTSIARDICRIHPMGVTGQKEIISNASRTLDTMGEVYGNIEMGTTMVLAYIKDGYVTFMHCGDSRGYLISSSKSLRYITADHVIKGQMDSPLTRCFFSGRPDIAVADIVTLPVESGDRIFLCSDGVSAYLVPDILIARLMDEKPLESIVDTIEFLCEKQSEDNYSGILIEIGD